jgi:hypothetical protein
MISNNKAKNKALKDLKAFEVFYLSHTNKETADEFGFSNVNALLRFCDKNGIAKKTNKKQAHSQEYYIDNIDLHAFKKDYFEYDDIFAFAKKYNLTIPMLYKILNKLSLRKHQASFDYYLTKISKDKLYKIYIEENNSRVATAKILNISENILAKLLKIYVIKKDKTSLDDMIANISREELESYYFSHTLEETEKYFNEKYHLAHKHTIMTLINYYKLDKLNRTKKQITDLINASAEKLTMKQIADALDIDYCNVTHLVKQLNLQDKIAINPQTSSYEDEIYDFLIAAEVKVERKNRTILNGQEIDLYLPESKIGIEFNGDFYHSSFYKEKNYHLAKSRLAKENGIRLIHIWEHEWLDPQMQAKLKTLLKIATGNVETKIYARQCELKQISNQQAKILNEANHLQGHRNAQVTYGLFYKKELVQLMSFSKAKYNKNLKTDSAWEIIRGCPGSNNIVIGGVSRLLKHFIADYKPEEIFSYCDFNKFDGGSYEKAGMKFIGYTGPDLKYLLPDGEVVNRNPKKYKELKNGQVYRLWGAGSLKYKLIIE